MSEKLFDDLNLFNSLAKSLIEDSKKGIAMKIKPEDLLKQFDISLEEDPITDEKLKDSLKDLILNTPKTSGKLFFNQLFGGLNSKSIVGDLLAVLLNNSMATYKIAGPQVGVENEIIKQVNTLIGYPKGCGGTFPTGGSMSNFMSLIMARDKKDKEIKNKGMQGKLIAYTSENSHYSIAKNASFSGIGKENVRYIKSNEKGQMDTVCFKKQVEEDLASGLSPFYLNATAGTTVLCAFDKISELLPICQRYNIWLHLDGAFGGTVIFSEKYKHLVRGAELTDSFCFSAHKTIGAPLSTSVLVVKDKKYLYNSFNNEANYLYQTDDSNYNLGQTSFECGRRNNALKFWTLWKAIGTVGIAKIVEHEFSLADSARNYVKENTEYTLYSFEDSLSVCFNYKDFDAKDLCTKLYKNNKLMVGFGSFHDNTFVRLVTINGENSEIDILNFFEILEDFVANNSLLLKRRHKQIIK